MESPQNNHPPTGVSFFITASCLLPFSDDDSKLFISLMNKGGCLVASGSDQKAQKKSSGYGNVEHKFVVTYNNYIYPKDPGTLPRVDFIDRPYSQNMVLTKAVLDKCKIKLLQV